MSRTRGQTGGMESQTGGGGDAQTGGNDVYFRGIGVASGVGVGRVFVKERHEHAVVESAIEPGDVPREIARFESALIATRRQLREIQQKSDPAVAGIFDAHILILDDRPFVEKIILGIEENLKNAESVLSAAAKDFIRALSQVNDEYLRERSADVEDVAKRIIRNLAGLGSEIGADAAGEHILVASDLSPSEVVSLDRKKVKGVVLDLGSPTAHAAIVAGKLGIPSVVGLHDFSTRVTTGEEVLVDGNRGIVVLRPSGELIGKYDRILETRRRISDDLAGMRELPAETRDGYRVILSANIESPDDIDEVLRCGASGVGLFRTEYFFMSRSELPSEDEQFEAYRLCAQRLSPECLIIRTLDLGGDKFFGKLDMAWKESNPFMGWRAIRFCLAQPDLFRTQLRAILRASVYGNVKIMYPMISNADEIARANAILDQAKMELRERGHPFNPHVEVGAMIEVPSAAMAADMLAFHVNFFSLGTNDLIQYTLAIDRGNERVAYLYEPTHIAILRLIKHTVDAGHRVGIWTGLCGGMGGDPLLTPLLLGLGVDELSVSPQTLPLVKDAIRSVSYSEARRLAEAAVFSQSIVDVQDMAHELAKKVAPDMLELIE